MDVTSLLAAEMRRALHRRAVRVLITIALVGVVAMGIVAFVDSAGKSLTELGVNGTHPALMADWWVAGTGDGILMIAAIPLLIGGLLGGATVAGAEWRAGTVTTVLTWEPRRLRVYLARTGSAFVLAALIAFVLQVLFLGATLPAVLANGSTAGVDGGWWMVLGRAMIRISLVTGGAALLGASLATLGRGTTFALAAAFGWMAVGENLIRGLKPGLRGLLIGDNLPIVVTWGQLEGADFTRSEIVAAMTLALYFGIVAVIAITSFFRRDIAGVG